MCAQVAGVAGLFAAPASGGTSIAAGLSVTAAVCSASANIQIAISGPQARHHPCVAVSGAAPLWLNHDCFGS